MYNFKTAAVSVLYEPYYDRGNRHPNEVSLTNVRCRVTLKCVRDDASVPYISKNDKG